MNLAGMGCAQGRLFALGNIAIDDLVFADGTTQWCIPGGGAVYAALGMALWTASVDVIAAFGLDYPIDSFVGRLGFAHCRQVAKTMRNWGVYEDDGTRHFLSRRATADWSAFSPVPDDLRAAAYAYCHLAPMPWGHLHPLIAALREHGALAISVDVHDREIASIGPDALPGLLRAVDVFLPSRQDTDVIAPGITALAALQRLRRMSPATAVIGVKCGAEGAILHAAGAQHYVMVPSAANRVVDATGAGDAFCGGFLAGFAVCGDVVEAALQGAVSASYALAAVGPFALAAASPADAAQRLERLRGAVELRPFCA